MIKQFLKDSFFYTTAILFTRGIGFLLLPVYTRVISKEDYGLFDYLTTISLLIGVVITCEIMQAVHRFIPEYKTDPVKMVSMVSTGFWFSMSMYTLFCIVSFIFSDELAIVVLDSVSKSGLVKLISVLFLANAALNNIVLVMRASLLPKTVVYISTFNAVSVAAFSLFLVVYLKLGINGLILGQFFGVLVSILIVFSWAKRWIQFVFCIEKLLEMLKFSAPLILSSVGVVLTMFVDRIMLKEFLGTEQLAYYSVAAKIASIVSLLMIGFQSALTPLIYANYEKEDTSEKLAQLFHFYLFFSLISFIVLAGLANWLVVIVAGQQYADAESFVAPLTLSALISSMYLFFPGLSIAKKTIFMSAVNVFVGVLNVALNFIVIPVYGALGAAFSTLFSVFVSFVFTAFLSHRYYNIPFSLVATIAFFAVTSCLLCYE